MLIDYKNVDIYRDTEVVLRHIDFTADEGEFIYIIGKVGTGKSSLLKTFYAELFVDEAEKAEVLGNNLLQIKSKHIPAMRKQMGIIFQDFQLLTDRTVYRNLRFVLRATAWKDEKKIEKRIHEVLEQVGMTEVKEKMPHELSGGEQQRIAIARALLNKPRLIIADEPTANLDAETAEQIVTLLRSISQHGTAIIMSTHNVNLIERFPGIVYQCCDGTVKEITKEYNKYIIDNGDEGK